MQKEKQQAVELLGPLVVCFFFFYIYLEVLHQNRFTEMAKFDITYSIKKKKKLHLLEVRSFWLFRMLPSTGGSIGSVYI